MITRERKSCFVKTIEKVIRLNIVLIFIGVIDRQMISSWKYQGQQFPKRGIKKWAITKKEYIQGCFEKFRMWSQKTRGEGAGAKK